MKRFSFFVVIYIVSAFLLLSFVACGSTVCKITGCYGGIVRQGEYYSDDAQNPFTDKSTVMENDYLLEVGKAYDLIVSYTATGGSRFPVMSAENVRLRYDADALEISLVSESTGEVLRYGLICKHAVINAAVIAEVYGKYSFCLVITAG